MDTIDKLRTENAAQAQEIDELKARVNELREAANNLLNDCINFDGDKLTPIFQENLSAILKQPPAQSLSAHDAAIKTDTIKQCAEECMKEQRESPYDSNGAGCSERILEMLENHDVR